MVDRYTACLNDCEGNSQVHLVKVSRKYLINSSSVNGYDVLTKKVIIHEHGKS
jgi:hypothetical protein